MIELTVTNIILLIALALVLFFWGKYVGQKSGRLLGYIDGKADEREYMFSVMPKDIADKIQEKEANKLSDFFNSLIDEICTETEEEKHDENEQ